MVLVLNPFMVSGYILLLILLRVFYGIILMVICVVFLIVFMFHFECGSRKRILVWKGGQNVEVYEMVLYAFFLTLEVFSFTRKTENRILWLRRSD